MLMVTQLAGFGGGVGVDPPSIALVQHLGLNFTEDTTDLTTYTFTNQSIGAVNDTRRVVVAVHWHDSVTSTTLSSATIGGIAATIHVQGTSTTGNCAIISALLPTGTTATIAFTLSGAADRAGIGVYRAVNETVAAPNATLAVNNNGSGLFSGTIAVPVDGWVVACCQPTAGSSVTGSDWVGVTKQYDAAYGDAAGVFKSGGFQSGLAAEAARTISCNWNAGTDPVGGRMVAVSWG